MEPSTDSLVELHYAAVQAMKRDLALAKIVSHVADLVDVSDTRYVVNTLEKHIQEVTKLIEAECSTNIKCEVACKSVGLCKKVDEEIKTRLNYQFVGSLVTNGSAGRMMGVVFDSVRAVYPVLNNEVLPLDFWMIEIIKWDETKVIANVRPRGLDDSTCITHDDDRYTATCNGLFVVSPHDDEALIALGLAFHRRGNLTAKIMEK